MAIVLRLHKRSTRAWPTSGSPSRQNSLKVHGATALQIALAGHLSRRTSRCGHYFLRALFFFFGIFAPALRASDRPIAMACLRLFTFLPDLPLFSVPRFISCMARSTFRLLLLFLAAMSSPHAALVSACSSFLRAANCSPSSCKSMSDFLASANIPSACSSSLTWCLIISESTVTFASK